MKKSTALLLTLLVIIIGLFLSVFYWSFNFYLGGTTGFLFLSSFGALFFAVISLVSFYKTARNKSRGRIILNAFFATVIFSYTFAMGLTVFNAAVFGILNGQGMAAGFTEQSVCAKSAGHREFKTANGFTEENGQHYIKVFCPALIYKTDRVVASQAFVDLMSHQE